MSVANPTGSRRAGAGAPDAASARTADVKALRVAQVVGSFGGGGAERQAHNLVAALGERVVESTGIAVRSRGEFASGGSGVIDELGADRGGIVGSLRAMVQLRRLVRRRRIDVLHVHGSRSLVFVATALWGMVGAPRVVFTWHDSESVLDGGTATDRAASIWALRRCAAVLGSSTDVASRLRARASLERVGVFHGGVPVRAAARPDSAAAPTILWMGRLVPSKDPAAMLRAAERLKSMNLRFRMVLAGQAHAGSTFADAMRRMAADLRVDDVVEFPGFVDGRGLEALLGGATVAVQSSRTEGLSMALLEQMMAGLAIVATDVGDTAQAVRHGGTGLLVPPGDDAALAGAIGRLLADAALRGSLGAAARAHALSHYSLDAMARRAADVYASIGAGRP